MPLSRTDFGPYISTSGFGAGAFVTPSFTAPDNCLLVVAVQATDSAGAAGLPADLTLTASLGDTPVARVASPAASTWSFGTRAWTVAIGTGGSMTVTADAGSHAIEQYKVSVFAYTGHNAASPVGATGSGSDADGDGAMSGTLSAAPAADSEVLAFAFTSLDVNDTSSMTPGSGWTELSDTSLQAWYAAQTQVRGSSTSDAVAWVDVDVTGGVAAESTWAALEIKADAGGGPSTDGTIVLRGPAGAAGSIALGDAAPPPPPPVGFVRPELPRIAGRFDPELRLRAVMRAAQRLPDAGGPQLVAVGQVTEVDLAQPIARRKQRTLGQVVEADTAQAIARGKRRALGQVVETDAAQAIVRRKQRLLGQAVETDIAQPISADSNQVIAVGQVVETDTAQAIARRKQRAVGQVVETDVAQAIARRKQRTVGQSVETDTAQPVARRKQRAVAQCVETDTAQAIVRRKQRVIGQATESDTAQPISRPGAFVGTVSQVVETDTAQPITWSPKRRVVLQVVETDAAQAVARRKQRTLGLVTETDAAQAITWVRRRLVAQVVESDTAQPIAVFLPGAFVPIGGGRSRVGAAAVQTSASQIGGGTLSPASPRIGGRSTTPRRGRIGSNTP